MATKKKLCAAALLVSVGVGVTIGVFTSGGSSAATNTPSFSVLSASNALVSLPSSVQDFIHGAAPVLGMSEAALDTRVHLLQTSLGTAGLDLYAFVDDSGRPCFFVPTQGGICAVNPQTPTPGFYWQIGGGGNGADKHSYLIGLAGDNVQRVMLTVDEQTVPVSLRNEVAFAEYSDSAKTAKVTVVYADGSQKTASLPLS